MQSRFLFSKCSALVSRDRLSCCPQSPCHPHRSKSVSRLCLYYCHCLDPDKCLRGMMRKLLKQIGEACVPNTRAIRTLRMVGIGGRRANPVCPVPLLRSQVFLFFFSNLLVFTERSRWRGCFAGVALVPLRVSRHKIFTAVSLFFPSKLRLQKHRPFSLLLIFGARAAGTRVTKWCQ